jgi:hypothetical protein
MWREWSLWAVQLVSSWRREIEKGPRAEGMTRYKHEPEIAFFPSMDGGLLLPQVYAYNLDTATISFTDDLIFTPAKRGLFQVVILPNSFEEIASLLSLMSGIEDMSSGLICGNEATVIIQDLNSASTPTIKETNSSTLTIARIASGEEFAADLLCRGRPHPMYYGPFRMSKEVKGKKFLIVRPDFFIYAAYSTREEISLALQGLKSSLRWQ